MENQLMVDMVHKIKSAAEHRHMTFSELSERVNLKRDTITSWKRTGYGPRVLDLVHIADELDVSLDWLCGRTGVRR